MKSTYRHMLRRMQEKESLPAAQEGRRRKRAPKDPWTLYILKCKDGTLYTGIAKDLEKRLQAHNSGKGARYTRPRRPVSLLYQESCPSRTHALVRECAVKALPRKKKEALYR